MLLLGDSFTEGYGLNADQVFGALLKAELQGIGRTEFINGGLSGTAPVEYGRLLLGIGLAYQPDVVLLCLYANDDAGTAPDAGSDDIYGERETIRTGLGKLLHGLWPRLFTIGGAVRGRLAEPAPKDFLRLVSQRAMAMGIHQERIAAWKSRLPASFLDATERGSFNGAILSYGLIYPELWVEPLDLAGPRGSQRYQAMETVVSAIVAELRASGIETAALFIPAAFQYDPATFAPGRRNAWRECGVTLRREWLSSKIQVQLLLRKWAAASNVPWLDLTPGLRDAITTEPEPLTWSLDDHWTPTGHRVAARLIATWLRQGILRTTRVARYPEARN